MFDDVLKSAALLTSALLFGGMLLFSASFAAFLFKVLPIAEARSLIRKAFPHFYLFVIVTSATAALLVLGSDSTNNFISAVMLAMIAATTYPTRQVLMPAINAAADSQLKSRFVLLHSLSVVITLAHIVASAVVILNLAA